MFLAKDVAEWIEYSRSNVSKLVNMVDDEKVCNFITTPGGRQQTWFLTEDGIYEILMLSNKPIAKQWKKEVKKILKQIRLTGGTVEADREAEFIENYFLSFSEDVKKFMVLDLHATNKELQFISNL
ncbi:MULTISPECIES: BRO-N domain-containing protein [Bacillus]|uniref:BRO-N domain-containing protein n=1 Tax=Bacillus cereus TaxID=1396 RepID=UPI001E644CCE